ncbi:MAG: porin, partial [Acidobacteriota bacterium]
AAKAQTANVTMYGSFRLALETIDINKDVGRKTSIDSWSSRWGIRGVEALGGGLNGIFHLETGVNLDYNGGVVLDGTAVANNFIVLREGWVGLNGNFGTVKMGAGLTPWDDIFGMDHLLIANGTENMNLFVGGVNPVFGNSFSGYGSVGGSQGTGRGCNNSTAFDARYGNSIRYDTPNFSGLTAATQFAFLGENTAGNKCKGWDSMVKYVNGPIEAGLAYARHIDFAQYDGDAWRAHAGYNFGVAKVLGGYERIKLDGNNGSQGHSNTRGYSIGVVVPVGAGRINAQYNNRNNGATTSATAVTEVANGGGKSYSVSYWHFLSKRTSAYTWAARVDAEDEATVYGAKGGRATSFGFGLRHDF